MKIVECICVKVDKISGQTAVSTIFRTVLIKIGDDILGRLIPKTLTQNFSFLETERKAAVSTLDENA